MWTQSTHLLELYLYIFIAIQQWWNSWNESCDSNRLAFNISSRRTCSSNCSSHSTNLICYHCVCFTNTQRSCQIPKDYTGHSAKHFMTEKTPDKRMLYCSPKPRTIHVFNLWYIKTVRCYKRYQPPTWSNRRRHLDDFIMTPVKSIQNLSFFYASLLTSSHDFLKLPSEEWNFLKSPIPEFCWWLGSNCTPARFLFKLYYSPSEVGISQIYVHCK